MRFVILAQARTGSSLLVGSLRQHPQIRCRDEVINIHQENWFRDCPLGGRERLLHCLAPRDRMAVGVKLHADQPYPDRENYFEWESAWGALSDDPTIRVICLFRQNLIAQLASFKIARILDQWGIQEAGDRPVVEILHDELVWFRKWNQMAYQSRLERLSKHLILPVAYEQLISDWGNTLGRIQQFLEVDNIPLSQSHPKGEKRELEEVVQNFSQLSALPWAQNFTVSLPGTGVIPFSLNRRPPPPVNSQLCYFIDAPRTHLLKGEAVLFEGWCAHVDWEDPIATVDLIFGESRVRAFKVHRQDVRDYFEGHAPVDCGFKAVFPLTTGRRGLTITATTRSGKILSTVCNTLYDCRLEKPDWEIHPADNCQILAPLIWSRQASPTRDLFVAIINYQLNERAIQYKEYFENVSGMTVQIINSCDSPQDEIPGACNISNEGYTGCWNAAVELFLASSHNSLLVITSDVTIDSAEIFDDLIRRQFSLFEDPQVWAYTCDIHYSYHNYDRTKLRRYRGDPQLDEIPMYDGMFVILARELVAKMGTIPTTINKIGWVQEVYASLLAEQHGKIFVKDDAHTLRHSPSRGYAREDGVQQEGQFVAHYGLKDYFEKKRTHRRLLVHRDSPKTILFLNHNESRTGAPKVLLELVQRFIERNKDSWTTYIYSATGREDRASWSALNAVTPADVPGATAFHKMQALFERISPDVVYANSLGTLELACYAKQLRPKLKVILHLHELIRNVPVLETYEKRIVALMKANSCCCEANPFSLVDNFITVCQQTAETLQQVGLKNILKSHPVINFRKIERKLQEIPLICFPEQARVIISVGDANYRKGFDRFLELASIHPREVFVWIGRHRVVEGQAVIPSWDAGDHVLPEMTVPLPENVICLDNRPNPFSLMRQAHASLILSREDPLPCAAIEMKFLGVPLITLRESGDSWMLAEEGRDIVLDEYDREKVSFCLGELLNHSQPGALNRALMSKWSPESIYDSIEKIIVQESVNSSGE